jgi:hypothetical protein
MKPLIVISFIAVRPHIQTSAKKIREDISDFGLKYMTARILYIL